MATTSGDLRLDAAIQTVFFDRSKVPANLLTVPEYRRLSRETYGGVKWQTAARKVAQARGGALVLRSNGSLIAYTLREDGKVSQRTYPEGRWAWETEGVR